MWKTYYGDTKEPENIEVKDFDWWLIFDKITRTFIINEENKQFFKENNPWALEEITRRLLEAWEKGLWTPAENVKKVLKKVYLEIEGWLEDRIGEVKGEFQDGSIDVVTAEEIKYWKKKYKKW